MQKITLFESGTQGFCGKFLDTKKNRNVVFKVAKQTDFLMEHEFLVLQRIRNKLFYCPHFMKVYGLETLKCEPEVKKNVSPFLITSKYPLLKKVIFEEYISGKKLFVHVKNGTTPFSAIMSIIKQVLCAIFIAQTEVKFTHYDLHSENVILSPCDQETVYLYLFPKKSFLIPSFGYTAKVIDFGFAFVDKVNENFLDSSMGHTNVGFCSDRFDPVADVKLFLISLVFDMAQNGRSDEKFKKFSDLVRNLFHPLSVDWETGWDTIHKKSAAELLMKHLEKTCNRDLIETSKIFSKYLPYSLDLLCNIIILPLEEKQYKDRDIKFSFETFIKEFLKIEQQISSHKYNMYILKCVIESARKHKEIYLEKKEEGVALFRRDVSHAILSVSNFCLPKNIHYEKMLLSLYKFAYCAEGFFYDFFEYNCRRKIEEYNQLPFSSVTEVVEILSSQFPEKYTYTANTKIIVIDSQRKTKQEIFLNEKLAQEINGVDIKNKLQRIQNFYVKLVEDGEEYESSLSSHSSHSSHSSVHVKK